MKLHALALATVALIAAAGTASADIITQWTFENQPVTGAPPYNNSPTPSTGVGVATPIGFDLYPTPNVGVPSCDILVMASPTNANNQVWRLREQAPPNAPANFAANGWSTLAPEYTQGAEFDVATTGYHSIKVSFDWAPTNKGVEDVELQYNTDITNAAGWTNLQKYTNTVIGGAFNINDPVDLSAIPAANNDANFGIRIVSAYHGSTGAYAQTNDAPLNDSSGNIRLDDVTISGTKN
jgi:hypothetical protein